MSSMGNKECVIEKKSIYSLRDILTWRQYLNGICENKNTELSDAEATPSKRDLASKISYFDGDITTLEVDAIVNAANSSLLGGAGVDGCIHKAAGKELLKECETLDGCETGDAKITKGYKLPCQYVIHTVGPKYENPEKLESCYRRSFELLKEHKLKSVAFPCIATGIYGFPNEKAAHIALQTTKNILEKDSSKDIERVIYCVFTDKDKRIYKTLLKHYFP